MIKFRGQRVVDDKIVEGHYKQRGQFHFIFTPESAFPLQIHPSTLQVMTTDGWADIADVEVVRKRADGSIKQDCIHKHIMYINSEIGWLCLDCRKFSHDKENFHNP